MDCDDNCGLVLEERLSDEGSVISSDWRRGGTTDGQELIESIVVGFSPGSSLFNNFLGPVG